MTEMLNCVDIIRPFLQKMGAEHPTVSYQVVGGTGSAALALAETVIHTSDGMVEAPSDLYVPQFRDTRKRNMRDVDLLVLSTNAPVVELVEATLEDEVGNQLKKSVFELKPACMLRHSRDHPFVPNMMSFLSDRYVEEAGGRIVEQWKGLHPFMIPVDVAALETFQLHIAGDSVLTPIPHPGATLLNYLTRSISGIRPKDEEKILGSKDKKGMAEVVFEDPALKEWVLDGPGKNLFYLARVLHGLRQPHDDQHALRLAEGVTLDPIHPSMLPFDTSIFMYATEAEEMSGRAARALHRAQLKSRVVHWGESNDFIVNTWQKFVEDVIGKVIHNK